MADTKPPKYNAAMLKKLVEGLWESWSQVEKEATTLAQQAKGIIQNPGHPNMNVTMTDLITYVKDLKQRRTDLHKKIGDLTTLTAKFVKDNMIVKP